MPLKDQIKNYARKLVESQPDPKILSESLRKPKPRKIKFEDDGIVPNHPKWPFILYRNAVRFPPRHDQAALMDALFAANGWGRSWRDTIYDFVHYHSQVHEVLGVARGNALLEFGGVKGSRLEVKAGDVAVLPAGTGHRLLRSSSNFLVVGAYPEVGTYDECTDRRDRPDAIKRIAKTRVPRRDPLYGPKAGLRLLWNGR